VRAPSPRTGLARCIEVVLFLRALRRCCHDPCDSSALSVRTIALFMAIRVPAASFWRPYFEAPITLTHPIGHLGQTNNNWPTVSNQDWVIAQGYIDAQGKKHDGLVPCNSNQTLVQCFQSNGAQPPL
jgi:hypothetical protein